MAKVFLDANIFIDIVEKRREITFDDFFNHELYLSPISIHILCYLYNYRTPVNKTKEWRRFLNLVSFDSTATHKALLGPTADFEDNIQLHSASMENCDIFLTSDKSLLKMKFFGNMRIQNTP